MNCPDLYFFGVYDGHGLNGKKVSQYVKTRLPFNLEKAVTLQMGGELGEAQAERAVSEYFTNSNARTTSYIKATYQTHVELKKQ
jgi:serine/threonine protein phosphatase PrpC